MSQFKVVVTDYGFKSLENEKRIITEAGGIFESYQCKTDDELINAAIDADILLVQFYKITKSIIDSLPKCKLMVRYGIGVDNIDIKAASEKGIYVANIPDYAIEEVSDHAIALMLSLIRKLPVISKSTREGIWDFNIAKPIRRIKGQTLGLVGFGRIPRLLNTKLKGFGFNVLVYDPFVKQEAVKDEGVKVVDLDTLIAQSDIISLHAPLTEETRHLFNIDAFKKMKDSAYLINTSRGPLVKEEDLIDALGKKMIAGAAVDVTETEPLDAKSGLRQFDNVIVTPHMAWYTEDAQEMLQVKAAECAVMLMKGTIPPSVINK